jgi:hypothetical protein
MKRLLALASVASFTLAVSAFAQDINEGKEPAPVDAVRHVAPESHAEKIPELNPSQVTPELYLYMHDLRRHDDPQQAVRRKAEARTAAREARITAMKWYGMSNARPQANPVPFMGTYSPTWIGGRNERFDWYGPTWPSVSLRVDQSYQMQR